MFSHIVLGSNDIAASKTFYDAVMAELGHAPGNEMGDRVIYAGESGILMVTRPYDGQQASFGNGVTVGLSAPSHEAVDAFHAAGLKAGGTDEGAPGPRPAIPNSYAAYLRDPTGNKILAWCVRQGAEVYTNAH
jgi:catechol 2,3-dioxygenase-like lactoylglutathione lyase family enzyme